MFSTWFIFMIWNGWIKIGKDLIKQDFLTEEVDHEARCGSVPSPSGAWSGTSVEWRQYFQHHEWSKSTNLFVFIPLKLYLVQKNVTFILSPPPCTESDWAMVMILTMPVHRQLRDRCSAANRLIGEVVQSRRRPLLGPFPGWKRLLALSHLRHY